MSDERDFSNSLRGLDAGTISAITHEVTEAKDRGWLQADLHRFFKRNSIDVSSYKAATRGEQILSAEQHGFLTALSITGLSDQPHTASAGDVRAHIEWLIEPARGAYDDALFEIAYDAPGRGPTAARLFAFDEMDEAVGFALAQNARRSNIYIGSALKLPDTKRQGRCSAADFYVATAVPIDIDKNYDAIRARMASVCEDGLVVTTGLSPERRSQHWSRLTEPCDTDIEFGAAFASLVEHTGADFGVKDSTRVMRMAGTVSFPSEKKIALGYCTELTALAINPDAKPSSLEALQALTGMEPSQRAITVRDRPQAPSGAIERGGGKFGTKVTNGRETFFRNIVLRHLSIYQRENGADPTEDDLWETAFAEFEAGAINDDQRWTSPAGQKELRHRIQNTLRRLRAGRLGKIGIASIDTGAGQEEAKAVGGNLVSKQNQEDGDQLRENPIIEEPGPFRASDLTGEAPERQWIVGEWIVESAVNSLYGDGGVGKTLLAQQLACSVSLGLPWLGLATKRGSVLAVLCEDDKDELHRRHNAIKASMGWSIGNPFEDVWLWPRVGSENELVTWGADNLPHLSKFTETLMAQVDLCRPSLLILDTLTDVYGGDEIDRRQVNYFVKTVLGRMIRDSSYALTVLLLGHPSQAGKSDGRGFSGSTAWNNAVRSRMYLTRPDEGQGDERILTRGKANYAASGDETAIRLFYEDGSLHAQKDEEDSNSLLWSAKKEAIKAVADAWRRGEPYSAQKGHRRNIYALLPAELLRSGYAQNVVRQAIRECIDDGKISVGKSHDKRGYKAFEND